MSNNHEIPADTTIYKTSFTDTLAIFEREGYVKIFEEKFTPPKNGFNDEIAPKETFVIYWNDGILLTAESYRNESINTSSMFYNWTPKTVEDRKLMSSGSYYENKDGKLSISGSHDVRGSFTLKVAKMKAQGSFATEWEKEPHLWVFNRNEYKSMNFDSKSISLRKIGTFPQYVKDAMGFSYD